jgi:hypothetical protein
MELQPGENRTDNFYIDDPESLPRSGVYYYYQIQTIAEKNDGTRLNGPMSDPIEAFILSPPTGVEAFKSSDPENNPVSLRWYPAIGNAAEQSAYTYTVEQSSDGSDSTYSPIPSRTFSGIVQSDGYVHADNLPLDKFYRVRTKSGTVSSAPGDVVAPAPDEAVDLNATKAVYVLTIPGDRPDGNGIYPVQITWKNPAANPPSYYHVQRSTSPSSGFKTITTDSTRIAYNAETETYTFIDAINTAVRVGKRYYYWIKPMNSLDQGPSFLPGTSVSAEGWGALTPKQYYLEFNKTIKSSHKKMVLMNKSGSTDKLGTETKYGTVSGSLYYNAALAGLGAAITMHYQDYADFLTDNDSALGPYFTLTGNSDTSANMSSNGSMSGTINATGMYPGSVGFGGITITGGVAAGGYYTVEPAGYPTGWNAQDKQVSWTLGNQ